MKFSYPKNASFLCVCLVAVLLFGCTRSPPSPPSTNVTTTFTFQNNTNSPMTVMATMGNFGPDTVSLVAIQPGGQGSKSYTNTLAGNADMGTANGTVELGGIVSAGLTLALPSLSLRNGTSIVFTVAGDPLVRQPPVTITHVP